MGEDSIAVKIAETDARARSNTRRIDKLEQNTEALLKMATSVEVLANTQNHMKESIDDVNNRLAKMESEPGNKWKNIQEKIMWVIIAAILAFVFGKIGLS